MCYSRDMDKPTLSPPIEHVISPPPEVFVPVPRAIVPPTEDDVGRMMAEEMQLFDDPAAQAMATRLLQAGYTVAATARKLANPSGRISNKPPSKPLKRWWRWPVTPW